MVPKTLAFLNRNYGRWPSNTLPKLMMPLTHKPSWTLEQDIVRALDHDARNATSSTRCVAHRLNAVNLYPAPSVPKKRVDVLKRQLVVLDCDGACLLEQQDDSGTYARLWEPLSLSTGTEPVRLLESLGLPTDSATIADCPPMEPYEISNQRVTEEVVVAKFREDSTRLCTPPNTRWYIDDEVTPLGMSIRTRKRLDLAKSQVTFS